MSDILVEKCHIKKAAIETSIHYYGRKKILEGQFFVRKLINEDIIDSLYYQGNAIWRSQPTEPFDFSLITVDKPDYKGDKDGRGDIDW